MKAQLIELDHIIAEHPVTRDSTGQLAIQGVMLIHWIYEVARDCTAIDEVRVYNGSNYVSFDIDRDFEPPRVNVQQVSTLSLDQEQYDEVSHA